MEEVLVTLGWVRLKAARITSWQSFTSACPLFPYYFNSCYICSYSLIPVFCASISRSHACGEMGPTFSFFCSSLSRSFTRYSLSCEPRALLLQGYSWIGAEAPRMKQGWIMGFFPTLGAPCSTISARFFIPLQGHHLTSLLLLGPIHSLT